MHWKILSISMLVVSLLCADVFALDTSKTTNIGIVIQNVFSIEFYTDQNVVYRDTVPFTNVDPNKTFIYPDGRAENDGKSDVGIVCKSNAGVLWYLKLHVIANPPLTAEKLRYYISQPYDRNTGGLADGTLTRTPYWYSFSSTPTTIYSAGFHDQSNLPFGTLTTFNFSLDPSGLTAGQAYSAVVVYTFSTTP
ncbi:MAG: hypothetical protein HZA30_04870 [Candidatus Omnitrophica bacterium]|nr:hypothetical protein [Candidatus Omnitrophota bacterium]